MTFIAYGCSRWGGPVVGVSGGRDCHHTHLSSTWSAYQDKPLLKILSPAVQELRKGGNGQK